MKTTLFPTLLCSLLLVLAAPTAAARTIEFETTEVTDADVALSPDGQTLIFTMLGHLFRLPVKGGTAEQLTFGPYYNTDPVFSPDGTRVAFASDRDGSEGNIFVLELATEEIRQLTHEAFAGRPTWSPGGEAIAYLSFRVVGAPRNRIPAVLRRVATQGGQAETLSSKPDRWYRSVFYLPDGRLAWTVVERQTATSRFMTRVEAVDSRGSTSTLGTLAGIADRAVLSPAADGIYSRRFFPAAVPYLPHSEELLLLRFADGAEERLFPVSNPRGGRPRFAVAAGETAGNEVLYLGDAGRLWKIDARTRAREPVPFRATMRMEIQAPVSPPRFSLSEVGGSAPPRSVLDPRLSPDGRSLVFMAAGHLWEQPLSGGPARRLVDAHGFLREPVFSPDGRQLAFISAARGMDEIKLYDFASRRTRTLTAGRSDLFDMSWSADGERLVFAEGEGLEHHAVGVSVRDGKRERLAPLTPVVNNWPRPHLAPDGRTLYFSGGPGKGEIYQVRLNASESPEPLTRLSGWLWNGLVAPDGKWVAFWRQLGIWLAPLVDTPITEEDVRPLTQEGGDTFTLSPDGLSFVYAAGNRVWRQPVAGGAPQEIPIELELRRETSPPLLLRRVRVLDFEAGGFGPEVSILVEDGRIRWIGSEGAQQSPKQVAVLDAGGRFAIPGLFEMHSHNLGGYRDGETFIAYAVTSVRDVGRWLPLMNALADRSDSGGDPLPRYFYSGDTLSDWLIQDEEDARLWVRRWQAWGASFIKIHPPISWRLQRAIAAEARRLGLPVAGHGTTIEEISKGVTLGYSFLEHTKNHERSYDDVLQLLGASGTRWDPTLIAGGYSDLLLRDDPERLDDPKFRALTPPWCIRHARTGSFVGSVDTASLRGRVADQAAGVAAAYRQGVKLHAGTDVSCLVPQSVGMVGVSLHWELQYLVEAGIPALEVLRIATQEAAAAVGAEDYLGTLEPGKLADIVLLDANPLEDIKNTQTIWRVIKGGWVFDPEKLRPPQSADAEQ